MSVWPQLMAFRKLDTETSKGTYNVSLTGTKYLPSSELDPELWSSLQEELKGKIIARLPLKILVQSQVLFTKWRSHFRSLPFQADVSCVSSKWPSYAPLFINTTLGIIRGYDRSTQRWETLFSVPSVPFFESIRGTRSTLSWWKCAGSLLMLFHFHKCVLQIFVTNPVTKSVRYLPPLHLPGQLLLDLQLGWIDNVHCYPVNYDSYRIVVPSLVGGEDSEGEESNVEVGDTSAVLVRMYDSASNSWTEPRSGPPLRFCCFTMSRSFAHLEGIFYLADIDSNETGCISDQSDAIHALPRYPNGFVLYVFDIETGKYEEIILTLPSEGLAERLLFRFVRLVVCQCQLMVVVGPPDFISYQTRLENAKVFIVFRFNPKSSELEEICRAEPWQLDDDISFGGTLFSDKDCIYVRLANGDQDDLRCFLVFDVPKRVWSLVDLDNMEECPSIWDFELIESAFEPGLNSFVLA